MADKGNLAVAAKKAARTKAINALNQYIYSLKDRCDSINDINKDLILQYCRFTVMSNEISLQVQNTLGAEPPEKITVLIDLYKEFNKISVGLYKTLKFDTIKDELKNEKNPYLTLLQQASGDGDF